MSLNMSSLGAVTLQITLGGTGGADGAFGAGARSIGQDSPLLSGLGGTGQNDTASKLAELLTGMMMMSMMGGGLPGGGLGNLGSGLGSTLGSGLGAGVGGALGGPAGAALGSSLGSGLGDSLGGSTGSVLDRALGLTPSYTPTSYDSGSNRSTGNSLSGTDASSPIEQLMKLFSEVMNELFGGDGAQGGNDTGRQMTHGEQQAYTQGASDALSALLNNGLSQGAGAALGGGHSSLQPGNNGLQGLSGPVDFQQLGNAIGSGIGQKAGIQALNDIGTHSDSATRSFINKGDRALAKEVGQFMDQYPEVFGKPQYQKDDWPSAKTDTKSWAQALSKPDDDGMTPASMDQFNKAKGMIKSAMAGDLNNLNLQARGAGGASLGVDAAMAGDAINNMALDTLSRA